MKKIYRLLIAVITQVILAWLGYFLDKIEPFKPAPDIIPNITGAGLAFVVTWFSFFVFFLCWVIAGFWKE